MTEPAEAAPSHVGVVDLPPRRTRHRMEDEILVDDVPHVVIDTEEVGPPTAGDVATAAGTRDRHPQRSCVTFKRTRPIRPRGAGGQADRTDLDTRDRSAPAPVRAAPPTCAPPGRGFQSTGSSSRGLPGDDR